MSNTNEAEDIKMGNPDPTIYDGCEKTDNGPSCPGKGLQISLPDKDGRKSEAVAGGVQRNKRKGDSDSESTSSSDSSSSETSCEEEEHDENKGHLDLCPDSDTKSASDSDSSTSGSSSGSPITVGKSKNTRPGRSNVNTSMCTFCGKGPFRNVKVHLIHCTAIVEKVRCSSCSKICADEKALHKHMVQFHVCFLCDEIFTRWSLFKNHICPKGVKPSSPTIHLRCSESLPNKCNICKSFFATENSLVNHMVVAHSKVVTSKVCIIPNPPKVAAMESVSASETQLVSSSSGLFFVSSGDAAYQSAGRIIKGDPSVGKPSAVSLPAPMYYNPSCPSYIYSTSTTLGSANGEETKNTLIKSNSTRTTRVFSEKISTQNSTADQPLTLPTYQTISPVELVVRNLLNTHLPTKPLASAWAQVNYQSLRSVCTSGALPVCPNSKAPGTVQPSLTVVAAFKNISQELSLTKYMNTSWRSKTLYTCRQCGAVSRQPSLIISHRYLHRGLRAQRCHCGRTFLRRLHLLRHCVRHAEATSYICVGCGKTFTGAKLLVEHMHDKSKQRQREKCRVPLSCVCGYVFVRPSAYIWHQVKNMARAKDHKKRLK